MLLALPTPRCAGCHGAALCPAVSSLAVSVNPSYEHPSYAEDLAMSWALMRAVWAGDTENLKARLAEGQLPDWSARRGRVSLPEQIAGKGGTPPLHHASRCGHREVCRLLLAAGADANELDDHGSTPLMWASDYGRPEIVEVLLSDPSLVDVDCPDRRMGRTALHAAAVCGHLDIVELLLASGAATDRTDHDGRTPLHLAADYNDVRIAAALLEAGAKPDRHEPHTLGLLHFGAMQGYMELVQLLCAFGAVRQGFEAEEAERCGHPELAAWLAATADCTTQLHYLELVPPARARDLLRDGADVFAARSPGAVSPLSRALEMDARGEAAAGSTAWLVLRAAELGKKVVTGPWSRHSHLFFPEPARARAVDLLWLGTWTVGGRSLPMEVWVDCVLPHAVPGKTARARITKLLHARRARARAREGADSTSSA